MLNEQAAEAILAEAIRRRMWRLALRVDVCVIAVGMLAVLVIPWPVAQAVLLSACTVAMAAGIALLWVDLRRVKRARQRHSVISAVASGPPNMACFLLDLLLSKHDREAIPGDLEEEFHTSILPRYGARRARFWFWIQTVRTIAVRNGASRWLLAGGLMRIGEWIFRQIGN